MLSRIPKIAHFYWDGSRVSYLQYLTIVSFHKYNPDWEIKIYKPSVKYEGILTWETREHKNPYTGLNYYNRLFSLPYVQHIPINFSDYDIPDNMPETFKSDLLRWNLLGKEGGMWSDMDILYIKPLISLNVPERTELTITKFKFRYGGETHIIGFYLSKRNNIFFQHLLDNSKKFLDLKEYQSVGALLLNKVYPTDEKIEELCPNLRYVSLPMECLYAYPPEDERMVNRLPMLFEKCDLSRITKNTIGIHWYNGHVSAKLFNNEFNHLTAWQFDNTLTHFIKLLNDDAKITY